MTKYTVLNNIIRENPIHLPTDSIYITFSYVIGIMRSFRSFMLSGNFFFYFLFKTKYNVYLIVFCIIVLTIDNIIQFRNTLNYSTWLAESSQYISYHINISMFSASYLNFINRYLYKYTYYKL